jgi:hypothetical protein
MISLSEINRFSKLHGVLAETIEKVKAGLAQRSFNKRPISLVI